MVASPICSLTEELAFLNDEVLLDYLQQTTEILCSAANDGYRHWVLAFSGGKDSSLVASLVVELIRRGTISGVEVDVVFSDTLMELPPFGENAFALLDHISKLSDEQNLPIRTHQAVAPIE